MTTCTVTKVRKQYSTDRSHRHIEGVLTSDGIHHPRRQVVDSINAGNVWKTSHAGASAMIRPMNYCPNGSCLATPYIQTNPDSTGAGNLENFPEG